MVEYQEQIKALEDELRKTKYNKATQGHFAVVKAKIALLREKQEARSQKKTGKSEHGYSVRKSGDATVLLLGYPSTGKSTLLNKITGANSAVAAYAFTTLSVIPGVLEYKQAKIQILDVPGIVAGAASGRGRGREVLAVIRNADLVLMVVDALYPENLQSIQEEAKESGIRMNKVLPEVFIKKKSKGGIQIGKTVPLEMDDETIRKVLWEFKINNADILIRSKINIDDLIDVIESSKKYLPAITCITKADLVSPEQLQKIMKETKADIAVSAETGLHVEQLKDLIFQRLNFMRVFLKEPKKEADMQKPLIVIQDITIEGVCNKLHRDFVGKFKFARVWGKSTKFPGQKLHLSHVLKDGDVLEIHLR